MRIDVRPIVIIAAVLLTASLAAGPAASAVKEQRLTLAMDEFTFKPSRVVLKAGVPTVISLVNRGKIEHEFMVYQVPAKDAKRAHLHDWAEDRSYFRGVALKVEGTGAMMHRKGGDIVMVMVPAGRTATLRFTPKRVGMFEIGCLVSGHYEVGMRGTWIVEPDGM